MTDAPTNVAPFGKYRGQPVKVMLRASPPAVRTLAEISASLPGAKP